MLTRQGWKGVKHVQTGDFVLSFNKTTYEQEWKPVLGVQPLPQEGQRMYRMQGSGMDVIASSDHRMLIANLSGKPGQGGLQRCKPPVEYKTVAELLPATAGSDRSHILSCPVSYTVRRSSKVTKFAQAQMRAVICAGLTAQPAIKIVIKDMERVCDWWWDTDGQLGFLAFLGFWLGDGHLNVRFGNVAIAQKREEAKAWLAALLDAVFPNFWYRTEDTTDPGKFVYSLRPCPPLYEYLRAKAIGPLGYNARDPQQLRSYPHFTVDAQLAAAEQASHYGPPFNWIGRVSRWTETDMLDAFGPVRRRRVPLAPAAPAASSANTGDEDEDDEDEDGDDEFEDEEAPLDVVDAAAAQSLPTGTPLVPWNNGLWLIINGHWFYVKRWLGSAQQIDDVYSRLSRQQAITLLDGFCRADGLWYTNTHTHTHTTGSLSPVD